MMYEVQIQGINVASFSEVSGLASEIETEDITEGGNNDFVFKLPGRTKYNNLTLKRGVTDNMDLYEWYKKTSDGKAELKLVSIVLTNQKGDEIRRWDFAHAYPIKWNATDLTAKNSEILIETLEIAYHGMVMEMR